jgi:enamine deaminase RidA (YjgF/YER057c/UK114 family)
MPDLVIDPNWKWDDNFPLAQGLKVGNLVFLSGQVALDSDGNVIGKGDLRAQTRQVFENIAMILARAGCTLRDVVQMRTYFTCPLDMQMSQEYFDVRREFFKDHRPASTGVQVAALVDKDLLLEVEVMAIKRPRPARKAKRGASRARGRR